MVWIPESSGAESGPENFRENASSLPTSARRLAAPATSDTDSSFSTTGVAPVSTVKLVPSRPVYADLAR